MVRRCIRMADLFQETRGPLIADHPGRHGPLWVLGLTRAMARPPAGLAISVVPGPFAIRAVSCRLTGPPAQRDEDLRTAGAHDEALGAMDLNEELKHQGAEEPVGCKRGRSS